MTNVERVAQCRNRLYAHLKQRGATWNKAVKNGTDVAGLLRLYGKDYDDLHALCLEMLGDFEVTPEPTLIDRYTAAVGNMMGIA